MVLESCLPLSIPVDIQVARRIFRDEVLVVADRVDASVRHLGVLEAAVWPHRFDSDPRLL